MPLSLGLDSEEAHDHLVRQLQTISIIRELAENIAIPPEEGSDLQVLVERLGDTPVHLGRGIQNYLRMAIHCLSRVEVELETPDRASVFVLQALLRPVLMSAGRVVFLLGPDDPDVQLERGRIILRQELYSYSKALGKFSEFDFLRGLKPPEEVRYSVRAQFDSIKAEVPHRSEEAILDQMADYIAIGIREKFGSGSDSAVLKEMVKHSWHTYSGASHGYVWPDNVPGDLVSSLGGIVPVAHLAFDIAVRRTRA